MARRGSIVLAGLALSAVVALGALADEKPKAKVVEPFNGKDLKGWKLHGDEKRSKWVVGKASLDDKNPGKLKVAKLSEGEKTPELINAAGGVDIYTEKKFGDCTVEVEVMVPKGSNSGIYLLGCYEVQVFDSYGKKKVGPGDMGGIYNTAAPKVNAAKKPGEWQKFVIEFQAPRFKDKTRTAKAKFLKVTLNGKVIHENVEVKGPTGSGLGKEGATGPLLFQGDHGPVAFRNIKITPKATKVE
jgi:hypothetical protein